MNIFFLFYFKESLSIFSFFFFFLGEREYKILTRNKFVTKGSLSIKMGYNPLDRRCGVPIYICVCVRKRESIYLHITYHVNIYDKKLFSTKHVRYVYITCENLQ